MSEGMLLMYQAQLLQVVAQMEGYKAANLQRTMAGESPAYNENHFDACRVELWNIEQEIRRWNNL